MVVKVKTITGADGIQENYFKEGSIVTKVEPKNHIERYLDEIGMYICEGDGKTGGILRQSLEPREYEIVEK